MIVEGMILRDGFKGLDASKVNFPDECEVYLGGPYDEDRRLLGTARLSRNEDGIHATFTLSELDTASFRANPYFGVALANPEEDGSQDLAYLGMTDSNQDPEIQPASGS
jgi:hypothetical protein